MLCPTHSRREKQNCRITSNSLSLCLSLWLSLSGSLSLSLSLLLCVSRPLSLYLSLSLSLSLSILIFLYHLLSLSLIFNFSLSFSIFLTIFLILNFSVSHFISSTHLTGRWIRNHRRDRDRRTRFLITQNIRKSRDYKLYWFNWRVRCAAFFLYYFCIIFFFNEGPLVEYRIRITSSYKAL